MTDQTSAHDLINGYLPAGWTLSQWEQARGGDDGQRRELAQAAAASCATHVRAMLDFHAMGVPTIDYGNNIRQVALDQGVDNAFAFPASCPPYPSAVLPRHGPVPMGGPERGSRRHLQDRCQGQRTVS